MKFSTEEYLKYKEIDVPTTLYFSAKDYDFLVDNNFYEITINPLRYSTKYNINLCETLNKNDILLRIKELYDMYDINDINGSIVNLEQIEDVILKTNNIIFKTKIDFVL